MLTSLSLDTKQVEGWFDMMRKRLNINGVRIDVQPDPYRPFQASGSLFSDLEKAIQHSLSMDALMLRICDREHVKKLWKKAADYQDR